MLLIENHGSAVVSMGLNRPEKRNAISAAMSYALQETLLQLKYDASVRVIVFHGVGQHFCAGMDLKEFFDGTTLSAPELAKAKAATEHWRTELLREMPQKIVTAVNGYCFGAALPILANSLRVFAQQDAVIGLPEINSGFAPGAQILKSVAQRLNPKALAYATLSARPMSAVQAKTWGLVHEVCAADPLARALQFARQL